MIPAFCSPPSVPLLSVLHDSPGQVGLASFLSQYSKYIASERKGKSVSTRKRQGCCQFASHQPITLQRIALAPPHTATCNIFVLLQPPQQYVASLHFCCSISFGNLLPSAAELCSWAVGQHSRKEATYAAEHLQDPDPIFYFYINFFFALRSFLNKIISSEKGAQNQ